MGDVADGCADFCVPANSGLQASGTRRLASFHSHFLILILFNFFWKFLRDQLHALYLNIFNFPLVLFSA